MASYEDRFLERLARGEEIAQDEYDAICADLPPADVAAALARRFVFTGYPATLAEAARLYLLAGMPFESLELCSRMPARPELRQVAQKVYPLLRKAYPEIRQVGRLLEEAFLVVDLQTGQVTRYPPLMPST